MPGPGEVLAASFVEACAGRGLGVDTRLRLLRDHAGGPGTVAPVPLGEPGDLGRLHEELITPGERSARGAWYTPAWLAELLVASAVDRVGVVVDPTCGGGAFLLAAADRLASLGAAPADVVMTLLWGADIDPLAVAVSEAALWWWSAQRGSPAVAAGRLVSGDALVDVTIPACAAVVGNPPFLGQLKSTTAVDDVRRRALRARWGDVVRPYTDVAWLFLLAAVDALEADGTVAMVQPQSLIGARDAGAVRAVIDDRATLEDCWIDDGDAFAAGVRVCAPVLRRIGTSVSAANDWNAALVSARGIPHAPLQGEHRLGDLAQVVAGFRDEYYGLVAAVTEHVGAGEPARPLVTVGAVDPLRRRSGPMRFAKARWTTPAVDPSATTNGRAHRWVAVQAAPKLIVATQTKVIEALVDSGGGLVASVPAIVVVPHDPADLWRLAAALHAPVASAWMLRRTAGTALAADACKPTAAALAALPLPINDERWETAAALAEKLAAGADEWEAFAAAADAAYGVEDAAITAWWLARLPVR